MITENAWPVHKHQDMTRVPFARRPLSCRSRIPRPARKVENTSPQPGNGARRACGSGPGTCPTPVGPERRRHESPRTGLGLGPPRPDAGATPGPARVGGARGRSRRKLFSLPRTARTYDRTEPARHHQGAERTRRRPDRARPRRAASRDPLPAAAVRSTRGQPAKHRGWGTQCPREHSARK